MKLFLNSIILLSISTSMSFAGFSVIECLVRKVDSLPSFARNFVVNRVNSVTRASRDPITPMSEFTLKDVEHLYDVNLKKLQKLGVGVHKYDEFGNSLFQEIRLKMVRPRKPFTFSEMDSLENLGVYEVLTLPNVKSNKSIFHRPEFEKILSELNSKDYKIVIDPSMPFSGGAAYFNGDVKVIALAADTPWDTVVHEYQHFKFHEYLEKNFDEISKRILKNEKIENVLSTSQQEMLGPEKMKLLNKLIKDELPELAVDEALSLHDELLSLGFSRYNPFARGMNRAIDGYDYILSHKINELRRLGDWDKLTHVQRVTLVRALRDRMLNTGASWAKTGFDASAVFVGGAGLISGAAVAHDVFVNPENGIIIEIKNGKVRAGKFSKELKYKLENLPWN